tara:strand:- start:285 stop:452 length:168 start_codon:yes stop_codon:yes gene_type:complete
MNDFNVGTELILLVNLIALRIFFISRKFKIDSPSVFDSLRKEVNAATSLNIFLLI